MCSAWDRHGAPLHATQGLRLLPRYAIQGFSMAPLHPSRLFDRSFRPDGNEDWGCGLGLSIVPNIADHHGAAIVLEYV